MVGEVRLVSLVVGCYVCVLDQRVIPAFDIVYGGSEPLFVHA